MLVGCWFLLSKEKSSQLCLRSVIKHLIYKVGKTSLILRGKWSMLLTWVDISMQPNQYINTLLVPKDGQIPIDVQCLTSQGIFDVVCVLISLLLVEFRLNSGSYIFKQLYGMWYVLKSNVLFWSFVTLTSNRYLISIAYTAVGLLWRRQILV